MELCFLLMAKRPISQSGLIMMSMETKSNKKISHLWHKRLPILTEKIINIAGVMKMLQPY